MKNHSEEFKRISFGSADSLVAVWSWDFVSPVIHLTHLIKGKKRGSRKSVLK